MIIRTETEKDYFETENLTREAFWNVYMPGCLEHLVLHRLHEEGGAVPELDFVIEEDGKIIANIVYAKAEVRDENEISREAVIFGPVSVLPEYQGKGYGSKIIEYSLEKAKEMGFAIVLITGRPEYYSRFGFEPAKNHGIRHADFGLEEEPFFMAKVLDENAAEDIKGVYADPKYYAVTGEEADLFDKKFPSKKKEVLPESQLFG